MGGSSTNDCGVGMLQALGYKFYDSTDKLFNKIIAGEDLIKIKRITSPSNLHLPKINVICDVNNPLFGEQGATYIYGKQKGGNDISLPLLEEGVINFSSLSKNKNIALTPGAGAAGGVGYACIEYLNGKLIPGNEYFMRLVNLEEKIKDANLVITGEGKLDNQTFYGKAIEGVYKLSNYFNKDLIIICGVNMLPQELSLNNVKILAISDIEKDINKSMCNAENLIMELTSNIKLE